MRGVQGPLSINCALFLPDDTLLTGNSLGRLTILAPVPAEDGSLDFMQKVFHGHNSVLSAMSILSESTVITGDISGTIRIWQIESSAFDLLNTITMPKDSGNLTRFQCEPGHLDQIYVSTSYDRIYKLHLNEVPRFEKLINGHGIGINSLSSHPFDSSFIVTTIDNLVMQYAADQVVPSTLKWISSIKARGMSSAIHPGGDVVGIACDNGEVVILSLAEGSLVLSLSVSKVCLNCIKYSPVGDFLATGASDGSLCLLPVADGGIVYESVSVSKVRTHLFKFSLFLISLSFQHGPFPVCDLNWSIDGNFICSDDDINGERTLCVCELIKPNICTMSSMTLFVSIFTGDLKMNRYMSGMRSLPKTISWTQPEWLHSQFILDFNKNNDHLKRLVASVVNVSRSKQYLVLGDDQGYLRLFSYPIVDQAVSDHSTMSRVTFLSFVSVWLLPGTSR